MSRQAVRDTTPEIALRKSLHAQGVRYRVAYPLPGYRRRTIDIAFTRAKVAVFVHGCFWHGCPEHRTQPKANAEWWARKLARNVERDRETRNWLNDLGWVVVTVWEHEDAFDAADRVIASLRHRRP